MYWQEERDDEQPFQIPEDVVDLAFSVRCRALPVDHAWDLAQAVNEILPWLAEQSRAGLHLINVAESGNGWERPEDGSELLYPSRRTKLTLRVPSERIDDARELEGRTINVGGYDLELGEAKKRPLSKTTTLFSRHMVMAEGQSEDQFVEQAVGELQRLGVRFKKILCGKGHDFDSPNGVLRTVSLMVSDMSYEDAVTLQEEGLGGMQHMGFGLFIPHKSV